MRKPRPLPWKKSLSHARCVVRASFSFLPSRKSPFFRCRRRCDTTRRVTYVSICVREKKRNLFLPRRTPPTRPSRAGRSRTAPPPASFSFQDMSSSLWGSKTLRHYTYKQIYVALYNRHLCSISCQDTTVLPPRPRSDSN